MKKTLPLYLFYIIILLLNNSIKAADNSHVLLTQIDHATTFQIIGHKSGLKADEIERGMIRLLIHWHSNMSADTLYMNKSGSNFHIKLPIPRKGVHAFYFSVEYVDTLRNLSKTLKFDNFIHYDVLLTDTDDYILKNAYHTMARFYSDHVIDHTYSLKLAQEALFQELRLYPQNYDARQSLYVLWKRKDGFKRAKKRIGKDIKATLSLYPGDPAAMAFAMRAYGFIEDQDQSAAMARTLLEDYPQSIPGARLRLQQIMSIDSTEHRMDELDDLAADNIPQQILEIALAQLINCAIQLDQRQRYIPLGERLLLESTSSTVTTLSTLAAALSEDAQHLNKAREYAQYALTLRQKNKLLDSALELRNIDSIQEQSQIQARLHDVLGWILYQQKLYNRASDELQKAVNLGSHAAYHYHYAKILLKQFKTDKALRELARSAAFNGGYGNEAYNELLGRWHSTGRDSTALNQLLNTEFSRIENRFINKVLARRIIRTTPDYDFLDFEGDYVRLSDQCGSVIVLCFWSTWSKTSVKALDILHRLAKDWDDDILFLTVATDPRIGDIKKFIKKRHPRLSILLDKEASSRFGVEGVPMIFVIDHKGYTHFTHRGLHPDLEEMLVIEMDDLLAY
ncbi:redoxin domain-containing protein [bacterium]|nr:redoxin domain-containing protein [bacterium]